MPEDRPTHELLRELREIVRSLPRLRLHVHPDAVPWISTSLNNTGLSGHVQVVADPECRSVGKGWIETVTPEQWRGLLALVGHRVTVKTALLHDRQLAGTLLVLNHDEATLDLGGGDLRYLFWVSIEPAVEA